jgi:hypothetical protein
MRGVLCALLHQSAGRLLPTGRLLHSNPSLTQLESSNNEIMAGSAFQYTPESWGNVPQTDCQPNPSFLNAPLRVLGPFSAGTTVNYQRSVSFHQYLILSFQLIKMGWETGSLLTITLLDQGKNVISAQKVTSTPKNLAAGMQKIMQRFYAPALKWTNDFPPFSECRTEVSPPSL